MSLPPVQIELEPALAELPLLDYVSVHWPSASKAGLRALFARGGVRSAGQPVSPRAIAREYPRIDVHVDPDQLPGIHLSADEETSGVKLLYQDDRIAVLNKPSGIPVIPDRARSGPSCLGFLLRRELESRPGMRRADFRRVRVVHRIDRLTSGVVLLARTLPAEVEIGRMFERGEVHKEYLALLCGVVAAAEIHVELSLLPGRKGKMRAGGSGKKSSSVFRVLERLGSFTLVQVFPRTGRTHQIRVHAWAMGHPLAVDPLYRVGSFASLPSPSGFGPLTLHARRLALPRSWGEQREFRAPLPADFQSGLDALRAAAFHER